jgi:predicted nucleotidyltransferase
MTTSSKSLAASSKSDLAKIAKRYHLDLIVLFGSQAAARARPDSDWDVAVRGIKPGWIGARRVAEWKWKEQVMGAVATAIPARGEIDISFLNHATPLFIFEVARHGKPLYERKPTSFIEFQSYATRSYDDNAKFFYLVREYLEKRFGERPGSKTRRAKTSEPRRVSQRT